MHYDLTKPAITIYLLFLDSEHLILNPFLKCGFGHVTIAIESPERGNDGDDTDVLVMDSSATSLNCFWVNRDGWLKQLETARGRGNGTWIRITRYINKNKISLPIKLVPGCTGIANYALGFSNLIFTPWALYKKLMRIRNRRDMRRYGILDIVIPGSVGEK